MITEAELAAIEAIFKLGTASEQQRILEMAVQWMHGHTDWRFDQAFLVACEEFRVPEEFMSEHREEIDRARKLREY